MPAGFCYTEQRMGSFFDKKTLTFALAIFCLALAARVLLFAVDYHAAGFNLEQTIHGGDAYYEISANIVRGNGFSADVMPPYAPHPLRTPLYPYAIAAVLWIFGSYWVVLALQLVVGSLSPVLAMVIAQKLSGSSKIALVVGAVMALEPSQVLFSSIFFTETFFIFLFLLFVFLFLQYLERRSPHLLAASALCLGVATLTKPTPEFLPLILIPIVLWQFRNDIKRGVVHACIFAAIFLAVLSPWLYHNYKTFGVVGMSAQPAFNLMVYLAPSVVALEQNKPLDLGVFLAQQHIDPTKITLANGNTYTKRAISIIKAHPIGLAIVTALSAVTFFTHDGVLTVLQYAGVSFGPTLSQPALVLLLHDPFSFVYKMATRAAGPEGIIIFFRLLNIFITIMFFVGVAWLWRKKRFSTPLAFAILLVLYFLLTTPINGLGVNARFRMPVEAVIVAIAAIPLI